MSDTLDRDFPDAAARLRATLAAVASATGAPDRSDELEAMLDGEAPSTLIRVGPRRGLLAVAAAVVVALVAAVLVAQSREDAGPPAVSIDTDLGTGWYLPQAGWRVTAVDTDFLDVGERGACPCTTWLAARPGSSHPPAIVMTESGAPEERGTEGLAIDVGGRPGRYTSYGSKDFVTSWVTARAAGRQVSVSGQNVALGDLVAMADSVLDQRDARRDLDVARVPLPAGFVATTPVVTPAWLSEHLLAVTATEVGTGRRIVYQVVPPGWLRGDLLAARSIRVDDGVAAGPVDGPAGHGATLYIAGRHVDIAVGESPFGERTSKFSEGDLRRFADGLHEVTTDEWRAALADAPGWVDRDVRRAATLTSPPLVVRHAVGRR